MPLASETGDPRRLRDPAGFLRASVCFGRPEGVLLPFVDVAESFSLKPFLFGLAFFFLLLTFDLAVIRTLHAITLVFCMLDNSIEKRILTSSSVYGLTSEPLL